jgi:hypothetical protein
MPIATVKTLEYLIGKTIVDVQEDEYKDIVLVFDDGSKLVIDSFDLVN